MQSLMFLKKLGEDAYDRIINIDLMNTAHPHPENEGWTQVFLSGGSVTIHLPFSEFVKLVEKLITQNYEAGIKSAAFWNEKRTQDMRQTIDDMVKSLKHEH